MRVQVAGVSLADSTSALRVLETGRRCRSIGWSYADPSPAYQALRDHIAFYPDRVDAAWLGEEPVHAQQSDFYGGWISADLVGPFKGPPGTRGW